MNPRSRKPGRCILVLFALFAATAALAQSTPAGSYAASLVDEAEYTYVHSEMLYTHDGDNRGYGAEHNLARANIQSLFQSFGLTTTLESFRYNSVTYYNVVGVHTGTTAPSQVYIIGGHFDSVNNPGADDNASGVAGVIEAARLLSQWPSDATIRFIAFDREEQGLIGSDAYATAHAADDIRGMISMDMIAYRGSSGDRARIYGRTASNPLKNALSAALTSYGGLTVTLGGEFDASDHAPFEWQGFDACCLIEYAWSSNPNYHTQDDSVDTPNYINYPYAADMTRGVVGWLVDAAGATPDFPLGDCNGDYSVDGFDVDPFVLLLTDPAEYAVQYPEIDPLMVGDCNVDGSINGFDVDAFVALLGA
ncbi:MAG: hypothetical protein CHACPFDD_01750 [Phycisphaerae bacterium]|nr:hypothetical protein [Phycisphaerae bacterium]